MKRFLALMLCAVMLLTLCACGKSEAAQAVDDQIAAIGAVTLESEAAIAAAEEAYRALPDKERAQVENLAQLEQARTELRRTQFAAAYVPLLGRMAAMNENSRAAYKTSHMIFENSGADMLETDIGYVQLFQSEESVASLKALTSEREWYLLLAGARNALSGDGYSLDFNDLQEQRVLAKCIRYNTLCNDLDSEDASLEADVRAFRTAYQADFPDACSALNDWYQKSSEYVSFAAAPAGRNAEAYAERNEKYDTALYGLQADAEAYLDGLPLPQTQDADEAPQTPDAPAQEPQPEAAPIEATTRLVINNAKDDTETDIRIFPIEEERNSQLYLHYYIDSSVAEVPIRLLIESRGCSRWAEPDIASDYYTVMSDTLLTDPVQTNTWNVRSSWIRDDLFYRFTLYNGETSQVLATATIYTPCEDPIYAADPIAQDAPPFHPLTGLNEAEQAVLDRCGYAIFDYADRHFYTGVYSVSAWSGICSSGEYLEMLVEYEQKTIWFWIAPDDPTSYQAGKDLVDEFPDGTGSVEDNILLDDYYFTPYVDEYLKNLD